MAMKARIALGLAATVIVAGATTWMIRSGGEDPYRGYRQATEQVIPGTFGYVLEPADGFEPATDPRSIYPELVGSDPDRRVTLTLATVSNEGDGVAWGPAWVFLTRHLCYFSAKGDFISPSRGGAGDGCSPDNMLVQVVDAKTGEFLAAFDAYDSIGGWSPSRETATSGVQELLGTRFH
jgi:hypothetical protein